VISAELSECEDDSQQQKACLSERSSVKINTGAFVSISHLSLNSVTDEYFIAANAEPEPSQAVRKQMARYLSRVSDKNKPLFVFN
jgi:hypothetical protein